jgi:hypothetical protein
MVIIKVSDKIYTLIWIRYPESVDLVGGGEKIARRKSNPA